VVTHHADTDPDDVPISWIRWRPLGQLSRDRVGELVFPPVGAEPGIYRFMIHDGAGVVAGYVGQAAPSLAARFSLYRSRGRKPSYPLEKKTTSRNALRLIAELQAGHTVSVAIVDHRVTSPDGQELVLDLANKASRSGLERRLILQLLETGIEVLNRNGNPDWERRRQLSAKPQRTTDRSLSACAGSSGPHSHDPVSLFIGLIRSCRRPSEAGSDASRGLRSRVRLPRCSAGAVPPACGAYWQPWGGPAIVSMS
jgi:hypothetical protein